MDNARDVDGFGGSGFLLSGSAPALDGFGAVTSTGVFPSSGGEAIGWRATSTIPPGGQQLFTAYDFTAACAGGGACGSPRVGDLRVFQYVDADVGQAVLRVQDDGTPSVRLETIDQTPGVRYGASITGAFLSGFNIAGGAADRYNNIVLSIVGNGQAVAGPNPGIIIKNLGDGFEHPDLGFVYGPADIVSVLAWDAEPSTTQAIVSTALAIVPPPPGPPVDSDFDGVIDPLDLCPGTDIISLEEDGGSIDPNGCPAPPILNRTDVPCSNAIAQGGRTDLVHGGIKNTGGATRIVGPSQSCASVSSRSTGRSLGRRTQPVPRALPAPRGTPAQRARPAVMERLDYQVRTAPCVPRF